MNIWPLIFITSTAFAAIGFVVVAVMWLKKLRETLAIALGETANQQIRTARRLEQSLVSIQKQQDAFERRLETLTEANIRMRQELNLLAGKVEMSAQDQMPRPPSRMVH